MIELSLAITLFGLFALLLLLLYPLKRLLHLWHQPNDSQDILNTGLTNIKHLFYLQIISKLLTFQFNTAIARSIDPSIYGVSHMQINLLLNILLPISREGFRRASLRENHDASEEEKQSLFSFSFLSIPLGFIVSFLLGSSYLYFSSDEENAIPNYRETMIYVMIASCMQLLVEPLFIQTQRRLLFQTIAIIEILAIVVKCAVSFTLVMLLDLGVLSFGLAEIFYSMAIVLGYIVYYYGVAKEPLFPHKFGFKISLMTYWIMFEWQTLQKLLLQEGEKIVLKTMVPLIKQGTYAIVSVLGSIVTRFVFQWVEEGMFPVFSMLSTQLRSESEEEAKRELLSDMLRVLSVILKFNILIGSIFAAFGPNYSYLLLHLIYGEKYSSTTAPVELSWMCLYLLLIGINGIIEVFSQSCGDSKTLMILNVAMGLQSAISIMTNIFLLSYNFTAGSIITSCFITITRILLNLWTIRAFVKPLKRNATSWIRDCIPHPAVLIILLTSFVITYLSELRLCSPVLGFGTIRCFGHVAQGGFFLLISLWFIYLYELNDMKYALKLIRSKTVGIEKKNK